MNRVSNVLNHVALVALLAGTGCVADEAQDPAQSVGDQGNAALRIASFTATRSATQDTVVALDAAGQELGRVELTHGTFTLSPEFRDDYDTSVIDGRRLFATYGEHAFKWEGAGYAPLLSMPGIPASQGALAALMSDPHVKPMLDRWQLGFAQSPNTDADTAYFTTLWYPGSLINTCNNSATCGTVTRGGTARTINTCGGGAAADSANHILSSQYVNQELVNQCCPPGDTPTGYQAYKYCPTSGTTTVCGDVGANVACKGCGSYYTNSCFVSYDSTNNRTRAVVGDECDEWGCCWVNGVRICQ